MTTIAAEILPDSSAPQVGVTVTGLDAGEQTVSIQVSWDAGSTWRTVAGGDHMPTIGGVFVRDHFPPLNVASSWRVVEHDVSGEPATESSVLTVDAASMWLQNPLDPHDAVEIVCELDGDRWLMEGTFANAAWSQAADMVQVLGADRPVASVGQRMIAGQVPVVIRHEVIAEAGALRSLLMSAGQLVLRGHNFDLLEPVAQIVFPGAKESRELRFGPAGSTFQVSTWDLVATQVRPVSLRFVVPWWTYDQVNALWAGSTYDAIDAARPGDTYLDWQRSPQP